MPFLNRCSWSTTERARYNHVLFETTVETPCIESQHTLYQAYIPNNYPLQTRKKTCAGDTFFRLLLYSAEMGLSNPLRGPLEVCVLSH